MGNTARESGKGRPRGVFLNCPRANCSIYESGIMFYKALSGAEDFSLDYRTIRTFLDIPGGYDFYLFNYHHVTMSLLDTSKVRELPGFKATFVLEMRPGDPFVFCPDHFDAYCVPDPTMRHPDPRVYAFPRPLEEVEDLPPYVDPGVPLIGSFGFATPGKGFDMVVWAVGKEFDRAVVRLNIPPATFGDVSGEAAREVARTCRRLARPGVDVLVSHEYLSKEELIRWCATNTINLFFYDRDLPGLAATTDQAVTAQRPLLVSPCETFRHIHEYITPYPRLSIREAVETTLEPVRRMKEAWSPARFREAFREVLADAGLLEGRGKGGEKSVLLPAGERKGPVEVRAGERDRILFVSHPQKACGIHQFGLDLAEALGCSKRREYIYVECASPGDLMNALERHRPRAVLWNYYPLTMPWVSGTFVHEIPLPHVGILHEVTQAEADHACPDVFDYYVAPDPSLVTANPIVFKTPRVIPFFRGEVREPEVPVIGSFGFGFPDKGFPELAARVREEFPEAVLRLHIPFSEFIDPEGEQARARVEECRKILEGSGVRLEADHDFLSRGELLAFLAGNSLNAFFYHTHKKRGISSVPDYALAVDRPLAITRCPMFRHLSPAWEEICVEHRSLREILAAGTAPLRRFKREWTPEKAAEAYDGIFDHVFGEAEKKEVRSPARAEPSGVLGPRGGELREEAAAGGGGGLALLARPVCLAEGFNRVLDAEAREELAPQVERLFSLVPETMERKIPEANVQQAFMLDAVETLASRFDSPRILSVGCREDTAFEALLKLGYKVDGIDPLLNQDLEGFYRSHPEARGRYHIVFATSVLEHVRHDGIFLTRVEELLAPGGFALFTMDFKEGFRPGDPLPREDYRLYTREDILEELLPLVPSLELVDEPRWECPEPDFEYGGVRYTFATLVLRKKES